MLTISPEQMARFSEVAVKRFEDQMVPFLATHFPDQSRKLGDERVRLLVRYGIDRARAYGIFRERDVCQYISLMFVFGGDFDKNPSLSSMRAALDDPRMNGPGMRIKALYRAASRDLRRRKKQ
jgi:hypothetical protein